MKTKEQAIDLIKTESVLAWQNFAGTFNLSKIKMPEIIIINTPKTVAGTAYFKTNKIEFNLPFAMNEGEKFIETIYHELAHIIQHALFPYAKQAHGPEFRHIMNSQGYKGNTYHSFAVAKAKTTAKETQYMLIDSISADEM